MSELLKDMYNHKSLSQLAANIKTVYNLFKAEEFLKSTMDESWVNLELKARGRQICLNLGKYLPANYPDALKVIDDVLASHNDWVNGFFGVIFADFVEVYGQAEENWDISMAALARYTQYGSAEFAVRPFIINYEERMLAQMLAWARHENEHIRRLASEGCRPALPWGQALTKYKKDPAPILPILEQLKADPSLYVRKSVANNLNDISKTHPALVAKLAKEWYGDNERTNWIVKHGCRTLLKKGNSEVLAIFGFNNALAITTGGFTLDKTSLTIGEDVNFSFTILSQEAAKVRLEYTVDYVKANGKTSRKIFQISEVTLKAGEDKLYSKNHSFANLSTRKHYPGVHTLTLIVNGVERVSLDIELIE
ncbi:MAG: DNA alkylation repair protein [Spirochaetaceae bacterium]|nr:DNA alkylation repair protein [Spirochaetaceae bacterium]